jgi:hypothetical protein
MRPYYGWVLFSQTLSPLNQSLPTDPKLFPRAPSFSITASKVKVGKAVTLIDTPYRIQYTPIETEPPHLEGY